MRRWIAGFFAAALVGLVVPSASAAGTTAKVVTPGNGAVLTGSVYIKGEGTATSGINSVQLLVDGIVVASKSPSGIQTSATVDYTWDTTRSVSGGIAPNGSHTIKVTTSPKLGGSESSTITVYNNNPPSVPTGVSASASGDTITVQWSANPEPDILGYKLERDAGSGFSTIAEPQSTSYSQKVAPGTYSYRVSAVRSSPTSSSGVTSAPSSAAGATVLPPPKTDDGAGEGGNGDSGGKSGKGGKGDGGGTGSGDDDPSDKVFKAGGKVVAPRGLPQTISLPATVSLPALPEIDNDPAQWGEFREKLPYDLSQLPTGGSGVLEPENVAARSPSRIIPPDGLRWVAAGSLAFALAMLLMVTAQRLDHRGPEPEEREVAAEATGAEEATLEAA